MGGLIGGLIATFLIRALLLLVMPKWPEAPEYRYVVANITAFLASMMLYAFGSADGGPPNWAGGFLYIIPQSVWLIVDLVRLRSRVGAQSTTTATQQVATSSSLAPAGPAPAPRSAYEAASAPPTLRQAAAPKEPSQGELVFWQSVKDSTSANDFEAYLLQFPQGLFRPIARNRLIALGGTPPSDEIVPPLATSAPPPAPAASSGTSRQASKADIQSAWRQIEESVDAGDYTDFAAAFPGTNDALQALRRARQVSAWSELDKSQPAPVGEFLKSGIFPALQAKVRRFLEAEAPSNAGLAALLATYQDEEREAQRQAEEAARVLEERKRADEALRTEQQAAADALKRKYRRRWAAVLVPLVMAGAGTGAYLAYDAVQKSENRRALLAAGKAAFAKADYSEGVRLYRLAADQGDAVAQWNLGAIYEIGWGVRQNDAEAVRWFRLAADQGDAKVASTEVV